MVRGRGTCPFRPYDHWYAVILEGVEADEAPGLWTSFGTALRLIVGWFSAAIGVLNLLAGVDRSSGATDTAYLAFHGMLFIGGLLLLSLSRLVRHPGRIGCLAGGLVAAAGLLVSAIPVTKVCCMTTFAVRHGWPFSLLARDETAGRWHVDSQHLLADLLFWGYAGLLALVAVELVRRVTHRESSSTRVTSLAG